MKLFYSSMLTKDGIILRTAGIVIIISFFLAARIYNPFDAGMFTCSFKNLTGHSCPTCGLSRSIHSFLSFQIIDSLYYNPLGAAIILFCAALLVKFVTELISKRVIQITFLKFNSRILLSLILTVVIFSWIFKLLTE